VTYPDPTGIQTTTKTAYVTVGDKLCTVPFLGGTRFNDAQAKWNGADFTGTVLRGPGAPGGNFIITAQSKTGGSLILCSSDVEVSRP
jgi:hypothetical protein